MKSAAAALLVVLVEGVGESCETLFFLLFFQTNFFPDLKQVNCAPLESFTLPCMLHFAPAFTAAFAETEKHAAKLAKKMGVGLD